MSQRNVNNKTECFYFKNKITSRISNTFIESYLNFMFLISHINYMLNVNQVDILLTDT